MILRKIVGNDTPADDKNMLELGLTQANLAEMLGLSTARISKKLNINPAIVLGV